MGVREAITLGFFGTFGHDIYRKGLKVFANLALLNAMVSAGQAFYQNELENQGQVPEDGMSVVQDAGKQFLWDNPKGVVVLTAKGVGYLFNQAADLHEETKDSPDSPLPEHDEIPAEDIEGDNKYSPLFDI